LTVQRVPHLSADYIQSRVGSQFVFLFAVNLMLLICGCFMDIISAIMVLAPLLYPIGIQFGVNPVHLGIIFIVNLEIGYLTPPLGINLFVSSSIFKRPFADVVRGTLPFTLLMLFALFLITYLPQISLWLVSVLH